MGRAGCPTHRQNNAVTIAPSTQWSSSEPILTHCNHGLDLRINPRCYLCHPVVTTIGSGPLDTALTDPPSRQPGTYRMADGSIEVVVETAESASYVEDMWPDEVAYLIAAARKRIADAVQKVEGHPHAETGGKGRYWIDRAAVLAIIGES